MYTDTHTHLYSEQFGEDRAEMIQRAIAAGVERMYMPNIDLDSIAPMHQLEKQFPENCFAMMGLHPCSVGADYLSVLDQMKGLLDSRKYAAIGETGIDLYWDKTFISGQKDAFRIQCEWAKEKNLPVVIHARDSFPEIFEVLDEVNDERLRGIFHCFTGTESDVQKVLSYNDFYFGIGGVITYKKSELPEVIAHIPADKLLLETDAPYLPPVPYRGKRNESAYLVHTAEKIADVLGMPLNRLRGLTTENANRIFG